MDANLGKDKLGKKHYNAGYQRCSPEHDPKCEKGDKNKMKTQLHNVDSCVTMRGE